MTPHKSRKPMSDINVVPYIDVMLVLLIIFMVTAPMLTQGVKVDLPQTTADQIPIKKGEEPLIVSVDSNGAYFLETGSDRGRAMALVQLEEQISKILKERPAADVLVRGDHHVDYGVVVSLMAMLKTLGAQSVGLITEDPRG